MKLENYHQQSSFFLIAGTCVVENEEITLATADYLINLCKKLDIPLVYKGSFKKANRTSINSFTGIGDLAALEMLAKVRHTYNCPVLTDIHESKDAAIAAKYVDVLQIPSFLFRQTDLLMAAAETGCHVNIKKGQFAGADAMKHAMQKVSDSGNNNIWLTERGNMFGYTDMIVDYRNIPVMQSFGVPVIVDCTHSVQQPNNGSGTTGGKPEMISTIAKAAIAVGADGLFLETHPNPKLALSDGANMLALNELEPLLVALLKIRAAVV